MGTMWGMIYYTTTELAKRYRTTRRVILKRAERRGIKPAKTTGRTHLWAEKEAKCLAK